MSFTASCQTVKTDVFGYACYGNVEAATVLSKNGAERSGSSLAEEAFFGDTSKVLEMIKQGNLVDQGVDEESWTPLILAAQRFSFKWR